MSLKKNFLATQTVRVCIRERETLTKRCIKRTHKSLNNWYEVKVVLDRRCTRYILLLYIYHIFEIYLRPKQRSHRVLYVFFLLFRVILCDFWAGCMRGFFFLTWVHGTPKIYTKVSKWNATQLNQRHQRIPLYIDFFWRSLYTRVIWRIHAYSIFFERDRCVYVSASLYILFFAKNSGKFRFKPWAFELGWFFCGFWPTIVYFYIGCSMAHASMFILFDAIR